jgi:hypothetical protein
MVRRKFGKAIGARSARKLIREAGGVPDRDLAAEWQRALGYPLGPQEEIIRLDDGRVLHIFHGSANIYASAGDARQLPSGREYRTSLWSNIFLTPFDHAMIEAGYRLTRWADDFVVVCRTRQEAEAALVMAVLHPWPQQRFAVKHPRWEPRAGIPLARICAGGGR